MLLKITSLYYCWVISFGSLSSLRYLLLFVGCIILFLLLGYIICSMWYCICPVCCFCLVFCLVIINWLHLVVFIMLYHSVLIIVLHHLFHVAKLFVNSCISLCVILYYVMLYHSVLIIGLHDSVASFVSCCLFRHFL